MASLITVAQVGLNDAEYESICRGLGRQPNAVELGMFGALWSEHCSYKSSRRLIARLPSSGPGVLQGPGENAGAVALGEDQALVLKMESHNHPSAVEPVQGAATGVGGILRDVIAMGARPIALLDSLRFGTLDLPRNRYLLSGVVSGISAYGNCVGVPTVGGEIYFHPGYAENPLVNVMCVGIAPRDSVVVARARSVGDCLVLVGSQTGRDGILGASFASAAFGGDTLQHRPAVQVGNPFLEKVLLEACLGAVKSGHVVAMQDLGAAGLTSAVAEVAARSGAGARVHLEKVPLREDGMTPYEIMLSESQERMLVVAERGSLEALLSLFRRWGLEASVIGEITGDGLLEITSNGTRVAYLPVRLLVKDAPTYERPMASVNEGSRALAKAAVSANLGESLVALMGSPDLCSREWVFSQYDHTVQSDTVTGPGFGPAVLRVKGTSLGIAMTVDGNSRYAQRDPWLGAAIAVAEAARNLACAGAEPVAVTNCLNYGNPERPEVMFDLARGVEGLGEACRLLGVPVVSGNVSLYNETEGISIPPTPIVGMVGVLPEVRRRVSPAFKKGGDVVALIGPCAGSLGDSQYLRVCHGVNEGPTPVLDLGVERKVQAFCRELARRGLAHSANDCSDGGMLVAVAESCLAGGLGFWGDEKAFLAMAEEAGALDAALFAEGQSRVVVSSSEDAIVEAQALARESGVPMKVIGRVSGSQITVGQEIEVPLDILSRSWSRALEEMVAGGCSGG